MDNMCNTLYQNNIYPRLGNVVFYQGYRDRRAYIITQAPLSTTIETFWKMIFEEKINSVVMLNQNTNAVFIFVYFL